jgi:hypothetical protein
MRLVLSVCLAGLPVLGCVAPIPPVHAYGSVGATTGTPGAEPRAPDAPQQSEFAYTVRAGVNPRGLTEQYEDDPTLDVGLGYEFEHLPAYDPKVFAHGPYAELSLWPSLRPAIRNRVGLRTIGELMFSHDQLTNEFVTGWGVTEALAVEFTGTTDVVDDMWIRDKSPATFGHGRGAWGMFLSLGYRSIGLGRSGAYWIASLGVTIRAPVSVSDVVTE